MVVCNKFKHQVKNSHETHLLRRAVSKHACKTRLQIRTACDVAPLWKSPHIISGPIPCATCPHIFLTPRPCKPLRYDLIRVLQTSGEIALTRMEVRFGFCGVERGQQCLGYSYRRFFCVFWVKIDNVATKKSEFQQGIYKPPRCLCPANNENCQF